MELNTPNCPTCGEPADSIIEVVTAWAMLQPTDRHGEFEYSGSSEVVWDSQEPVQTESGHVTVGCCNIHEWLTVKKG